MALSEKLQDIFSRLRGKGRLSEADVAAALREVRIALLEADVSYKVTKDFVSTVQQRAVGEDILRSLTPGQQVIKIVHEELTKLMGAAQAKLAVSPKPPTVIMMVGLQGSGKTTSSAKIALFLKGQGKRPLLVAADIYRPAAIEQLQVLGSQIEIPVFAEGQKINPVEIALKAREHALGHGNDHLIIDTAGRLHINEELMDELKAMRNAIQPTEILLVVDAMLGQDAVKVAASFHEQLTLSGIVLTKLDGDTRGGSALSVKAVTGCPIKFTGVGEKLAALEPFYPDRMASRILGMGDMLTFIEKAQQNIDAEKMAEMEAKLRQSRFTLDDFLQQMSEVRKMGDMKDMLSLIPGLGKQIKDIQVDEKQLVATEAIIRSMTKAERENPAILNGSRKRRVALGCGRQVQEVNRLLKQFEQMQKMMKQLNALQSGKKSKLGKGLQLPF
ncbi:MAG: signal recognition particle protein [Firmicutes bacterium]|nr:signal recognition particle protein [Bacillota bacterium]